MKKIALVAALGLLSTASHALTRHVFYDFDNLSHGGFSLDLHGEWSLGDLLSNSKPEGIKDGTGSLEILAHLKPQQAIRLYKGYQNGDLSAIKSLRFYAKATKPGLKVNFFAMTNEWKWSQLPVIELKPGVWTEVNVKFSDMPTLVPGKMNAFGLAFDAWGGYEGSVYVDSIDYFAEGDYGREKARATTSGFEVAKKTVAVDVAVDGAKAYGVAKKGLIAFNSGDPVHDNVFASQKLKEAGPGIMRMWGFGGYHTTMTINPAEGEYHWEYFDREVKHLLSLGWEPMFCLGEVQKWNADPKRYVPKDFFKWAKMAGAMVKHYNRDLKLNLKYWEIWNEHDIEFWGGTEEEYLQLLRVACKEMKAADPSIHIYAGVWANPGMVKKAGAPMLDKVPPKGLYDGITWHNYLISVYTPEEKIMGLTPLVEAPAYNAWSIFHERGLDMDYGMSEANINPSAMTDWRYEGMLGGVYWGSELIHFILQNSSLAVFFTFNGDDNYASVVDRARPSYQSILLYGKYAKIVGKQWLQTSYPAAQANLETLALADDKNFSILAVNKDLKGTAFKAGYQLSNLPALKSLHAWGIREKQREVTDLGLVPVKNGKVDYVFPPYSVTILTGSFETPRSLAAVQRAEPSPAALGLAVLGQYSWNGKPAVIAKGSSAKAAPAFSVGKSQIRLARDAKNLYVLASVKQDHAPRNNKEIKNLWNGDSIELDISSKADMAGKSRLKKSDSDYQIVMAPTSASGKPAIFCFSADFKNMEISVTPDKAGYTLAATIPLSNFSGLDWPSGKKIRFDMAVSRSGADGNRENKTFWNATTDAWDSPDEWGLAVIE